MARLPSIRTTAARGPGGDVPSAAGQAATLEAGLLALLDAVDAAVVLTNRAREILRVNRRAEELWGYPERKLVGKPLQLLLSFETRPDLFPPDRKRGQDVLPPPLALEGYRSDGAAFPVEARIHEIQLGSELRYTITARDVSRERGLEQRLRHLETAIEGMPIGVAISDLDGRLTYVNPALAAMHGAKREDLVGSELAKLTPEALREEVAFLRLMETGPWRREGETRRRDGSSMPVEISPTLVGGPNGEPIGVVTLHQDSTERKRAEAALKASEERYALAVRGANDGLWDWDLASGEIYFSDRWKSMLGLAKETLAPSPTEWLSRVHPEDRGALEAAIKSHLARRSKHLESEHRVLHTDGSYRWMLARGLAVWNAQGKAQRMAGSQTDVTDRKVQDPLTGLPNRALLLDRLATALARASRHEDSPAVAVLLLDLDRFKVVNDSLGHALGDQLLVAFAARLAGILPRGETLARLGGDEFAILVDEPTAAAGAANLAQAIQGELARPFELAGEEVYVTTSIGVAVASTSGGALPAAGDLLRDADTAMHRAKSLGRNRFQVFSPSLREAAVTQLRLETDLRRALERNELVLYYQPIVSLADNRISGFEALVRWDHPVLGLLLPAEFIPLAEETGLIVPIGLWVLRQACWQVRLWQRDHSVDGLAMSVNLSAKQLAEPDLVEQVKQALGDAGLAPSRLRLEITESAVIDNQEQAFAVLEALRKLGAHVAIDDFGTGYSSLSYLHRFPVDSLKIDRSFVSALGVEDRKADLVRAIVSMARDMGIDVVAEGVETGEQLASLRKLTCDYMQGYCFSRPLDASAAAELLSAQENGGTRFKLKRASRR